MSIRRTRSIASETEEKTRKESDSSIVLRKPVTTAEGRDERIGRFKNKTSTALEAELRMAQEFEEIAELAQKHEKLQTLIHNINKEALAREHWRQKSGKATGIDGTTKEHYGEKLDGNLESLIVRMKAFSYRPQAVRRTYIPKAGSDKLRPLGIPAYEDKLVQGVMRKILDRIYEDKFYPFSFGFREGKSCHQAIREVNQIIMTKKVNFVVDADIKGFFDNVDHEWMMKFLEHDIGDMNYLRYVKRFLKAGVMEDMAYHESDKGTPQGGLISPVLANVYLHYALDMWFDKVVTKKSHGEAYMVRYADDFVCFFQYEGDAERFYRGLEERLMKFGLELAKDKSKIIRFGRFAKLSSKEGKTEAFDFLGFTHINGETRTGKYCVAHRTSRKKLKAKKQAVKEWLQANMHGNVSDTINLLNKKLIGHYRYYGVSGNYEVLMQFRRYTILTLYKVLARRSQRRRLTWERYLRTLEKHPILNPKIYYNIWEFCKV